MKRLFWGGLHPADRKELSSSAQLDTAFQPKVVAIPMQQHIGAPCTPLVQVGDQVKLGQKVGDGQGLCVPVHASVSGKVIAIEPRRHPSGRDILSVVIENDGQDTPDTTLVAHPDYSQLDTDTMLAIIREAGVVGHGGAAFPSNMKALTNLGKIDTLIVNACECEPYITADDILLRTSPAEVLEGIRIVAQLLTPSRTVLAIEDNKKTAISVLKEKLDKATDIELMVLPTRYPQGAEKQLIQSVTGRQVPSGQLPSAVHCAVFNAATYYAVYRAVCQGKAVTDRIVTVTGEAVRSPRNVLCRIGTSYQELIDAAGGLTEDVWKVVCGGPMMGFAQENLSTVTIKGTNSVLCLAQFRNQEKENPICIRCGRCVQVCPMHLQPLYLFRFRNNTEELKHYHVMDCMECGCCSYTCPGKLPLVESIRQGKSKVKEAAGK